MYVATVSSVLELSEFLPFQEMSRLGLVRPLDPEKHLMTIFITHQCTWLIDRVRRAPPLTRLRPCEQGPPIPTRTTLANSFVPCKVCSVK
jgi:hypothetical protein